MSDIEITPLRISHYIGAAEAKRRITGLPKLLKGRFPDEIITIRARIVRDTFNFSFRVYASYFVWGSVTIEEETVEVSVHGSPRCALFLKNLEAVLPDDLDVLLGNVWISNG